MQPKALAVRGGAAVGPIDEAVAMNTACTSVVYHLELPDAWRYAVRLTRLTRRSQAKTIAGVSIGSAVLEKFLGAKSTIVVVDAVAEYRGACVNEDAVDACLAAARCSIIDAEAVGPPDACGDAIAGRVHQV